MPRIARTLLASLALVSTPGALGVEKVVPKAPGAEAPDDSMADAVAKFDAMVKRKAKESMEKIFRPQESAPVKELIRAWNSHSSDKARPVFEEHGVCSKNDKGDWTFVKEKWDEIFDAVPLEMTNVASKAEVADEAKELCEGKSLGVLTIVVLVVGGILVLIGVIVAVICCSRKQEQEEIHAEYVTGV